MAPFADHGADRAAAQRLLHRPQEIAGASHGDGKQAFGCKAEQVETAAIKRTAFGECHRLGDPADACSLLRRQPQRETSRRRDMRLARRGDLMQRAAEEAAAERCVDAVDAERKAARLARDGGLFQGAQALAQLLEHHC